MKQGVLSVICDFTAPVGTASFLAAVPLAQEQSMTSSGDEKRLPTNEPTVDFTGIPQTSSGRKVQLNVNLVESSGMSTILPIEVHQIRYEVSLEHTAAIKTARQDRIPARSPRDPLRRCIQSAGRVVPANRIFPDVALPSQDYSDRQTKLALH
jgi:hypothetical protein